MDNTCDRCQKKIQRDVMVWETILNFYSEECLKTNNEFEKTRLKNQEEAFWCRSEQDIPQNFFPDPKQRLVARFVKSYLNTSWHKIQSKGKTEKWFDSLDIVKIIQSIPDEKDKLSLFSKKGLSLLEGINLINYDFNQFQEDNFNELSKAVDSEFEKCKNNTELPKSQRVSSYEKAIIAQTDEPYQTILKMQKVLPGYGIALTCDFLKESHLWNIAKPDVHLCHVFSVIDRIQYSMDLVLVKRIAEFAKNVGMDPIPDNFCNTGSYYIDKIIWMLCSRSKTEKDDKEMSSVKGELLSRIASI